MEKRGGSLNVRFSVSRRRSGPCFFPDLRQVNLRRFSPSVLMLYADGQRDTKRGSASSRLMRTAEADGSLVLLQNPFGKPKTDPGSRPLVGDVWLEQAFPDGGMDSMSVISERNVGSFPIGAHAQAKHGIVCRQRIESIQNKI
jgi:hypothetical protein